nr:M23 family metallopeptidase [Sphingomonas telluris]
MTDNVQRFALDLVVVDEAGLRFRGSGSRNEDFHGWERPVVAPGDGIVVAAHDGQPDNDKIGAENNWHGRTWESSAGNYVAIRHNDHEVSVLDHMRQGSVKVQVGDKVRSGQVVGLIGNSGSSLMPHLHYELQDHAGVNDAHGLPAYFRNLRLVSGQIAGAHGAVLDSGDIVIAE